MVFYKTDFLASLGVCQNLGRIGIGIAHIALKDEIVPLTFFQTEQPDAGYIFGHPLVCQVMGQVG